MSLFFHILYEDRVFSFDSVELLMCKSKGDWPVQMFKFENIQ